MAALLGCYLLARSFLPPWPAWYTTFVVSMTPIVFASSRYFMTDFLAMALAVWIIYALLQSDWFRNTTWVFVFAVLNGLAILTRTPGFLYYLVPCGVVVLVGLCCIFRKNEDGVRHFDGAALQRWVLHCVLTLVVSTGIFAPWYFHHLETFNAYWAEKHEPERGSPLAEAQPQAPSAAADISQFAFASVAPPLPDSIASWPAALKHPPVPWSRYPTYVVNNGMFLPLFVLALLGIPIALVARRYRSLTTVLLLLWVFGAWLLLVFLLKDSTARYALPVIPALAFFAALAVLSPPWKGLRALTTALFAAWLVFQYGNLTVRAYGDFAHRVVPVELGDPGETPSIQGYSAPFVDPWAISFYHDAGLVVYKDVLTLSDAYGHLAAPTPIEKNFKNRIFQAMARFERDNAALLTGDYANYLQLEVRGMEFDQRHYWPQPNLYATRDWLPEEFPRRKLLSLGRQEQPEPLLRKIANATYVVYAIEQSRPEEEARWQKIFTDRGFALIERFPMERRGQVPARNYGVLARTLSGEQVEVSSAEDIANLTLEELYQLATLPGFKDQTPEARALVRQRFEQLLDARATPFPANENALFLWAGASKVEEDTYDFTFLFRSTGLFDKDWDMYFRGSIDPEFLELLPEEERAVGVVRWDFTPTPPTSAWNSESEFPYVMLTRRVRSVPARYLELQLGFYKDDTSLGMPVRIPDFDFRMLE
jgi:hypothetical protein